MTKKLLHKTRQVYLIFSITIFMVVAPLFYFISQKFYIKNIDETLYHYKTEFLQNSASKLQESDVSKWNEFNSHIQIKNSIGLIRDSLFNTFVFNKEEQENEPYRELNAPIKIEGKPYTFSASISSVESEDLIANIALLFFVIILFLLTGLYIITQKLSTSLWKPFYGILQQIESFEIDKNKHPQFTKTNIEEFNRLNKSVENLINKNLIIYENQREFIENAAHELQTPIAVFQAKIDTLIQRTDVTKEQSELLGSLNESVAKLKKLNKNILLLSKIDKNQFNDTSTFAINDIIQNQLEFFTEQAKQKNIKITNNLQNACIVTANIGLTEVLVSNLFLNAIKHNIPNGEISVLIKNNQLSLSNSGNNNPLNINKLFERFSKMNSDSSGNGLGLAIIKKIAKQNKWKINYQFQDNQHVFLIDF
jgi:signal transduction histidine kinase